MVGTNLSVSVRSYSRAMVTITGRVMPPLALRNITFLAGRKKAVTRSRQVVGSRRVLARSVGPENISLVGSDGGVVRLEDVCDASKVDIPPRECDQRDVELGDHIINKKEWRSRR